MSKLLSVLLLFLAILPVSSQNTVVVRREFLFDKPPFESCHASTIAEIPEGFVVAFFGGSDEGKPDVSIWVCRNEKGKWTPPTEVANGLQTNGTRFPCWNPVLFQVPGGSLFLFYKVGPSPSKWWGLIKTSDDGGKTWSEARKIPDGFLGPIKNKPVLLSNGSLICPSSTESDGWVLQIERTNDLGITWDKSFTARAERKLSAIQPSILVYPGGKLQLLCRTKEGCIAESWSDDNGVTWGPLAATSLPNPNSGIDAVTLKNGRFLLVYNPTSSDRQGRSGPRTPLVVAQSRDGKNWGELIKLETEEGEYSYPAVIQSANGLIHITYTWNRKSIKHVVLSM